MSPHPHAFVLLVADVMTGNAKYLSYLVLEAVTEQNYNLRDTLKVRACVRIYFSLHAHACFCIVAFLNTALCCFPLPPCHVAADVAEHHRRRHL